MVDFFTACNLRFSENFTTSLVSSQRTILCNNQWVKEATPWLGASQTRMRPLMIFGAYEVEHAFNILAQTKFDCGSVPFYRFSPSRYKFRFHEEHQNETPWHFNDHPIAFQCEHPAKKSQGAQQNVATQQRDEHHNRSISRK